MYKRRYIEIDSNSLKNPIAVLGLPGIANVGKIAVETLVQALDAQLVMHFFSDDFPPRVFVKDGVTQFPTSAIHLYRAAPDEPHDIIILTASFQPASSKGVFDYADFVVKELAVFGVNEVFALAAYEQSYEDFFSNFPSDPRVFISASSLDLRDRIMNLNGTIATKEGVVHGANGFIPAWAATMYNMEGACLLGETLGMIKMDFRAARTVLVKLSDLVEINLDFDIMNDQVAKVVEFLNWAREEIAQQADRPVDSENPSDRYIG
jgi:proteasome assembly chaperone (PAC2) family protein